MKIQIKRGTGIAVLAHCLCASLLSAAGDWPQWRGPDRDGVSGETGLLQVWPEDGPPLVWKATGLGAGFAGVAVVGPQVFTMGDQSEASHAMALDRETGKRAWSTKVGKAGAPGWGGFTGPRATPTVEDGLVFVLGQYGEVMCLNAGNGNEVWRRHLTDDFGGVQPEWGFSESPLVDGDQVMLTPGGPQGTIVALDKQSGELRWQSHEWTDNAHYSSIIVGEIGGVRQYIQLTDQSVAAVSSKDGELLWKVERKGRTAVIPTPISADNYVYVTSGYGVGCNLFKVTQGSDFTVEEVYANKVMVNQHGGALKFGKHVYGYSDGKGWTCQDFESGEAIWQEKRALGKGSILYADGRLYCREEKENGVVALLEATPDGYKEQGRFTPPDRSGKKSWPHPVIAGGQLYLRDQDILLCYDVKAR
jgi:outer membrane protein assembly factor BamB